VQANSFPLDPEKGITMEQDVCLPKQPFSEPAFFVVTCHGFSYRLDSISLLGFRSSKRCDLLDFRVFSVKYDVASVQGIMVSTSLW
jgi:hypothetical protein